MPKSPGDAIHRRPPNNTKRGGSNIGSIKINIRTENLTILFVDIAGFTAATSRQSRRENAQFLHTFNSTLLPLITAYRGTVVKSIGDALLLTFRSPTDAMLCAMSLQDAMHAHNLTASAETTIHIRVAAHLGEVRITKKDIFGEPVNVASRIEGITPSEEIYLSEAVYMAMNKAEVPAKEVGFKELKGVSGAIRVYNIPRFSTHRLVPDTSTASAEEGSEILYPYGGMHYRSKPSPLVSLLHLPGSRRNLLLPVGLSAAAAFAVAAAYLYLHGGNAGDTAVASVAPARNVAVQPAASAPVSAAIAAPAVPVPPEAVPAPAHALTAAAAQPEADKPVAERMAAANAAPVKKPAPRPRAVVDSEVIEPPAKKAAKRSVAPTRQTDSLVEAKAAYRDNTLSKEEYRTVVRKLKLNYKAEVAQLKRDYKDGKITKAEYAAAVRKAKLELKNGD